MIFYCLTSLVLHHCNFLLENKIYTFVINPNLVSCICHCLCVNNNSYLKDVCANNMTGNSLCVSNCINSPVINFGYLSQCGSSVANILCTDLNVGVNCDKQVRSINTAKAWGIFNFNGGSVNYLSGYNLCSIFRIGNPIQLGPSGIVGSPYTCYTTYGLRFCNPIKAPFSASFSVSDQFYLCNYVGLFATAPVFCQNRLSDIVLQNCVSISTTLAGNTASSYIQYLNPVTLANTTQPIYEIVFSPILSDSCCYCLYTLPSYFTGLVSFQVFSC